MNIQERVQSNIDPSVTGPEEPVKQLNGQPLELRILGALRRIIQSVAIHSRKLQTEHNITGPQLVTLLNVVNHGPLTPSAIGKRVHLSTSTIVGILDRLESKGLVSRERSTHDRRHVYVNATNAGRQLIESAPSPLQDTLADSLGSLSELEQTAIAMSLERVVDLMEARDLEGSPHLEVDPLGGDST